jgi:hypothetical protein
MPIELLNVRGFTTWLFTEIEDTKVHNKIIIGEKYFCNFRLCTYNYGKSKEKIPL